MLPFFDAVGRITVAGGGRGNAGGRKVVEEEAPSPPLGGAESLSVGFGFFWQGEAGF